MRVLVTGSRDWEDRGLVFSVLNELCPPEPEPFTVVHGDCPTGADHWADEWCAGALLRPERHPADWDRYRKRAGFLRNKAMIDAGADLCVAFIRDGSRGASMTARLAEEAGIETWRYTA